MRRSSLLWLFTIAIAASLTAGCGTQGRVVPSTSTPTGSVPKTSMVPMPARVAAMSTTVRVSGAVMRPTSFDLDALKALPATTQTVGNNLYTGVSLWTLLDKTAGILPDPSATNAALSMYVVATGTDGYHAVLSLAEIDPGFGNRAALVAYSVDGAPLGRNGMARLIVPGDAKMGRAVSGLATIELLVAPAAR